MLSCFKKYKYKKKIRDTIHKLVGKEYKIIETIYELNAKNNKGVYVIKSKKSGKYIVKVNKYFNCSEYNLNQILYNCDNPNIQQLYKMSKWKNYYYFFYEYVEGYDLYEYIDINRNINEIEIKHIMKQLINGLSFLHSHYILHCDLKLDNIIINPKTKHIKIIDFDLAVLLNNEYGCILSSPVGTANYIAPESINKCIYSEKSEVWQLGVILYALALLQYPYDESLNNMHNINFNIINVEPSLITLLQGMLKYNDSDRYTLKQVSKSEWLTK